MIRRTLVIWEKGGLFVGSSDHVLSIKTFIKLLPGSSLGSLSSLTRGRNVFTGKCKKNITISTIDPRISPFGLICKKEFLDGAYSRGR